MNKELFKFYDLPSLSFRNKRPNNMKIQKEFQTLTVSLGVFEEVKLEWLLSFLESFLKRINIICDNTVLHFLQREKYFNSDKETMRFFLDNLGNEYNEIARIIFRHTFDYVEQSYKGWARKNPLTSRLPA